MGGRAPDHKLSTSSSLSPAWRRMLRSVPVATSLWRGTVAVSIPTDVAFTNFTWLPLVVASVNPAASNLR